MLTQAELERERYEARRKWQMDHNSGLGAARKLGERIGGIHVFERLLGRPETPTDQLEQHPDDELERLLTQLQTEVLQQRR